MKVSRTILVLFGVMVLGSDLRANTPYHSREGFSLTLPDNWTQIPDQTVQQAVKRMLPNSASNRVVVDSAFQTRQTDRFEYPYVMAQVVNYPPGKVPNEADMRKVIEQFSGGAAIESGELRKVLKDT